MFFLKFMLWLLGYAFVANLTYRLFERFVTDMNKKSDREMFGFLSFLWPLTASVVFVRYAFFESPRWFFKFVIPDKKIRIKVEEEEKPVKIPENYHCQCCPQRALKPEEVASGSLFRDSRFKEKVVS